MNRFLWPLIGFVLLVVLLAVGLNLNPRDVPSPLVGKPAPAFYLKNASLPKSRDLVHVLALELLRLSE